MIQGCKPLSSEEGLSSEHVNILSVWSGVRTDTGLRTAAFLANLPRDEARERKCAIMRDVFTCLQGRCGEDRPGAAVAAGNDDVAEMDLRAVEDGVLEMRQSAAL